MEDFRAPEIHLKELRTLLLSEETLESTLDRVVRLACQGLQGSDAVGVTLVQDSTPMTAAATDDFTLEVDRHQYETGEGPCLEAYRTGKRLEIEDIAVEKRWPKFVARASKEGLRSSLSFPLTARDEALGALNIYAKSNHRVRGRQPGAGREFADQAGVTLANAEMYASTHRMAENLMEALKSRADRPGQGDPDGQAGSER